MRSRGRERGQSLVEFAIVLPVFMFILMGVVQGGVILWASNTLNQVVRDTGRFAATVCGGTAVADAESAFSVLAGNSGGPWQNADATVTYAPATGSPACPDDNNDVVWVTVSGSMQAFVFFPVVPGGGNVSSSTTFRVEPNP